MPTAPTLELQPSELAQVVESVFETMLNLQARARETPWLPGPDRMTASVHLTGDWRGAVLLECDRGQACRFAGRFLSIDPPGEIDDIVRDVLGELANMIGGNLKSMLMQGIRLSIPSVVDGSSYNLRICGARPVERLAFLCEEGAFWVTVLALGGDTL